MGFEQIGDGTHHAGGFAEGGGENAAGLKALEQAIEGRSGDAIQPSVVVGFPRIEFRSDRLGGFCPLRNLIVQDQWWENDSHKHVQQADAEEEHRKQRMAVPLRALAAGEAGRLELSYHEENDDSEKDQPAGECQQDDLYIAECASEGIHGVTRWNGKCSGYGWRGR